MHTIAFPIVPLAHEDEWLGYWLLRVADRYGMSVAGLITYFRDRDERPVSVGWHMPLALGAEQWGALARATRRPVGALHAMQRIGCVRTSRCEYAYCAQCFAHDVVVGRDPYWRRAWSDASSTWCSVHDRALNPHKSLARVSRRRLDVVSAYLCDGANDADARNDSPSGQANWWTVLAREAHVLSHLMSRVAKTLMPVIADLVEAICLSVLKLCRDHDAVSVLMPIIGCRWRDHLRLEELNHVPTKSLPVVGHIREFWHRAWVLGVVAAIAAFRAAEGASELSEKQRQLRQWVWRFLLGFDAPGLSVAVRAALAAGLIQPWPEVEKWKIPASDADWFRSPSKSL